MYLIRFKINTKNTYIKINTLRWGIIYVIIYKSYDK